MKKLISTTILLFAMIFAFAQNPNLIKESNKIHWYGLDFTKAKMIGSMGFTNPYVVCDRYIKEKWNAAIFREHEKYNISKFTGSKEVKQHYNFILEQNSTVTSENLVINDDYEIDQEIVQGIINEYPTDDGLGLVFIIESFNKFNDSANIWITFFDTNSKKILKTKKYSGRAGGFSVLNFWLGGVYDVCKQLRKDYKRW